MNEKYELYCKVLLKTGETGIIVESYNDGEAYEIELPPDNEEFLKTVRPEEIEKVLSL